MDRGPHRSFPVGVPLGPYIPASFTPWCSGHILFVYSGPSHGSLATKSRVAPCHSPPPHCNVTTIGPPRRVARQHSSQSLRDFRLLLPTLLVLKPSGSFIAIMARRRSARLASATQVSASKQTSDLDVCDGPPGQSHGSPPSTCVTDTRKDKGTGCSHPRLGRRT